MIRVAAGDTDAFDEIHRRHRLRVLALARKLCVNRDLADDVAQEAFISLWRGAHAYRPERGNVSAWLSTLVHNRAVDAWRRAAVRPVEVGGLEYEAGPGHLDDRIESDPRAPERAFALSLIAELPDPQKEAVFLAYYADLSQTEIATLADAPLGTVKSRLRLGMAKLREGLDAQRSWSDGVQVARPGAQLRAA